MKSLGLGRNMNYFIRQVIYKIACRIYNFGKILIRCDDLQSNSEVTVSTMLTASSDFIGRYFPVYSEARQSPFSRGIKHSCGN